MRSELDLINRFIMMPFWLGVLASYNLHKYVVDTFIFSNNFFFK